MLKELRNIIPLGELAWGIYPRPTSSPITYLYYRPDGDIMLYRTIDSVEINLKSLSSYQNVTFFRFQESKELIKRDCGCIKDIIDFETRTIEANKVHYRRGFAKDQHLYGFILVPAVFKIHSIFLDNEVATQLFSFDGVYEYNDFYYYVFRTTFPMNLQGHHTIDLIYEFMQYDDLLPFMNHIADYNDPHNTLAYLLNRHVFSNITWKEGYDTPDVVDINFIRGDKLFINSIPIKNRQILIDTESPAIYIDGPDGRIKYTSGNPWGDLIVRSNSVQWMEVVEELPVSPENNVLYIVYSYRPVVINEGIGYWAINEDFVVTPFI